MPPTKSANARMLAESRGFFEIFFSYTEFSSKTETMVSKEGCGTWFSLEYLSAQICLI